MKKTVFVDEEGNELNDDQPKGKRGPKPGSKRGSNSSFTAEEIAGDVNNVFGAILNLFGRDHVYTEEDFVSEAKGIKSALEKSEILRQIWLGVKWAAVPIGLIKKFFGAPKAGKQPEGQNEQPTGQHSPIRAIR